MSDLNQAQIIGRVRGELAASIGAPTLAQRNLIDRAARLTLQIEQMEARLRAAGRRSVADHDAIQRERWRAELARVLTDLGLGDPVPDRSEPEPHHEQQQPESRFQSVVRPDNRAAGPNGRWSP